MGNKIELKLATKKTAECLHRMQVEAFMPLYEKYQDDNTNPAKESLERVIGKIVEEGSEFYFIECNGEKVGGVRVCNPHGEKEQKGIKWISPLFVIPKYQNRRITSKVMENLFELYSDVVEWHLATIKQEPGNCHLYEKYGFIRTGEDIIVNDRMTLVNYIKNI